MRVARAVRAMMMMMYRRLRRLLFYQRRVVQAMGAMPLVVPLAVAVVGGH